MLYVLYARHLSKISIEPYLQDKPAPGSPQLAMVSRRAIISRSRDDLQHHLGVNNKNFTGEDQWFSKEKLYKVTSIFC